MTNMQTHNTRWRFERRQDIGGRFISIKGPDPVDGESPRSSAAVYESSSRDLYDLFGRIADEQANQQVAEVESNATMPTTIPSDWQRVDYFCEQGVNGRQMSNNNVELPQPDRWLAEDDPMYGVIGTGYYTADTVRRLVEQAARRGREAIDRVTVSNKLPKVVDPADWQWEDTNGRIFRVDTLTRDDLMQVACICMDALENAEAVCLKQQAIFSAWRSGRMDEAERNAG